MTNNMNVNQVVIPEVYRKAIEVVSRYFNTPAMQQLQNVQAIAQQGDYMNFVEKNHSAFIAMANSPLLQQSATISSQLAMQLSPMLSLASLQSSVLEQAYKVSLGGMKAFKNYYYTLDEEDRDEKALKEINTLASSVDSVLQDMSQEDQASLLDGAKELASNLDEESNIDTKKDLVRNNDEDTKFGKFLNYRIKIVSADVITVRELFGLVTMICTWYGIAMTK